MTAQIYGESLVWTPEREDSAERSWTIAALSYVQPTGKQSSFTGHQQPGRECRFIHHNHHKKTRHIFDINQTNTVLKRVG
ncbi:TPA: hypothetical protein JD203_10065 [Cronobacter sakazakii]|uniref:hypothetical protein n=1 Tax=Cronobacter sakazakii TaxID=28141 RepID=UPI000A8F8AFF|nr:hypothetical protein [Cronobacter sakazakii]EIZ2182105.1 hypothetical protein [Cronobacter sakazakii]EIZ2225138.1 hypothetical protein [Cronobacter sakazakii]EIZ2229418.1 hypothetical protein [Cronobacter sakazakii]EIZ3671080.1 hypothetical protein [Cronobacter sakazakii]EIZ3689769.1 hypothetical protein [Cronobacter sakazakii]